MKHTALILMSTLSSVSKPVLADSFTYKGCYEASAIKSNLQYNNQYIYQSSSYCENKCSGSKSKIAALISGNKCYCSDTMIIIDSADDSKCSTECFGYGYENCGGDGDYFSVYEKSNDLKGDSSFADFQSATLSTLTSSSSSFSSKTSTTTTSSSSSSSSSSTLSSLSRETTAFPSSSTQTLTSSSSKTSSTTVHTSSANSSSSESASVYLITITHSNSLTVITQTATVSAAVALNASQNRSYSSMSKGSIAGIVVGILAGVLLVAGLIIFCNYRSRKHSEEAEANKTDEMIQNYVQANAMSLKQKSLYSASSDFIDDEKHITNDKFVLMSNDEELAIDKGKRRFSAGSLPDARDNRGAGFRVTNPDL